MSLPEFQQFLLEYQGELWAVDRLQVQEFMFSFLRDPLREIEEPHFFLDEVSSPFDPSCQRDGWR